MWHYVYGYTAFAGGVDERVVKIKYKVIVFVICF